MLCHILQQPLHRVAGDGPRLGLTYSYGCRRRARTFFSENTNEEVSPSTDPDATVEVFAAVQRCAIISICICGVCDVIGRALYYIWLAYGGILIVHVTLHLVTNAKRSSDKQRGAQVLQN